MKAIILAGGKGTRLPKDEQKIPKCLVEVSGKPILQRQIEQLRMHGFNTIRLSLGHRAGQVINWLNKNNFSNYIESIIETEPLGTGGGIKNAILNWNGSFVVLFGDILADFNFKKLIEKSENGKYSVLTGVYINDVRGMGVLEYDKTGKILAYKEKITEGVSGFINANASVLNVRDFKDMPQKFSAEYDFFPEIIKQGRLFLHKHNGYWFDCGTKERLINARNFFTKIPE